MALDTLAKLRQVYRPPAARAGLKVLDHLDLHCRKFIALSPFYVISSARADGRADASPRGDPPGSLAHVLDARTLLLPDRPGNRQVDTLLNLLERPYVGLVFFVPGLTETLRVNGRAEISTQAELLQPLAIKGKLPISVLKVTVEEAFLHCAKALIRARLWEPDAQVERSCFPTYGRVLADQIAGADAAEIDAGEEESARTELY
ncbi:MAG: pyridoxamine 5'-phosphate oxidase family protein [Chloroflexota bacterium]|nr:pyridoxamine 5'-phosphate oxidase family protein [Chloroflexota bacterium]